MKSLKAAEKFMRNEKPEGRKSKLDDHYDSIKLLLENNYTLLQVQKFLKDECQCQTSYSNLQVWKKRKLNNVQIIEKEEDKKVESPNDEKEPVKPKRKKISMLDGIE